MTPLLRHRQTNVNITACWLRDSPAGLTFNNFTLCPHCIYQEQPAISVPYNKLIGFYNREKKCGSLNKAVFTGLTVLTLMVRTVYYGTAVWGKRQR